MWPVLAAGQIGIELVSIYTMSFHDKKTKFAQLKSVVKT
jgi:hypothetical protein